MRGLLLALVMMAPFGVLAQEPPLQPVVRSQVLTINSSRLFPETLLGQAIIAELNDERRAVAAQNETLARAFRDEELELTEQRATLSRAEFARLAEDFDARVQAAREEADAKETELAQRAEQQERAFTQQVQPILGQIMQEAGAVILIEQETVILRSNAIDVTDLAIARIDAATELLETPIGIVDPSQD